MKSSDFQPARILTVGLQAVLVWQIVAAFVTAGGIFMSMSRQLILPPGVFEVYETLRQSLNFWHWIVIVVLAFWTYRISKNTHALASPKPTISPGWAVGWYFVPFANLVQPYLVMSELYNANRRPDAWSKLGRPVITGIWWGLNVLGMVLGVAVVISRMDMGTPPLGLAGALLAVIGLQQVSLLAISWKISGWQGKARSLEHVENVF